MIPLQIHASCTALSNNAASKETGRQDGRKAGRQRQQFPHSPAPREGTRASAARGGPPSLTTETRKHLPGSTSSRTRRNAAVRRPTRPGSRWHSKCPFASCTVAWLRVSFWDGKRSGQVGVGASMRSAKPTESSCVWISRGGDSLCVAHITSISINLIGRNTYRHRLWLQPIKYHTSKSLLLHNAQ